MGPETGEARAERGLGLVVLVQIVDRLDEEADGPERRHDREHDGRVHADHSHRGDEQDREDNHDDGDGEGEGSEVAPQGAVSRVGVVEDLAGAHAVRIDAELAEAERGHPFE